MLILLIILLCFSAFFSACEMAFSSLNRIKLKSLAEKSKRARLALKMCDAYDKLLSTVLIGNKFVNIASSSLATALLIGLFGEKGVAIATAVMTVVLMVFGDISPKTLAKEVPELTAMRSAPVLRFFVVLLTPINYLLTVWKKFLMILFPVKQDRSTTEDELLTFVGEVRQEGGINIQEEQMIRQVIEFDDIKVAETFTPRVDVAAVSAQALLKKSTASFWKLTFQGFPCFRTQSTILRGLSF
jgi:Mg2+/Co2+ transporter CorB